MSIATFFATFPANSLITLGLGALLGLVFGSFLNVVIYRLPRMMQREWDDHLRQEMQAASTAAASTHSTAAHSASDHSASDHSAPDHSAPDHSVPDHSVPDHHAETVPAPSSASATSEPFNLVRPASACPHCGHRIAWHENIPVLSYLWLKGRCSSCATPIGIRYPLIELITAALFAFCLYRYGLGLKGVLWCTFSAILVALAAIDWDTTLLPDDLNQPLLWIGLVASALGLTGISLPTSLAGAVIGFLFFWSLYWLFRGLTGKEGLGRGDFKLLAALGAWLGWQALPGILIIAGATGLVAGLVMRQRGTLRDGVHIPFGPFLVLGGLVLMVYEPWRTLVHF
jgi:leader peptidase (prepilin peptidase) / N-methyltransferase